MTFNAEAGKTYRIYSNTDLLKRELDVYVVDVNSGQRVPSTVTHRFTIRGKE